MIREVVVTAGAMRSPHILLNSGIGSKEQLQSLGVEVVKDLPGVGENLHNHVSYQLSFTINESNSYDNDWAVAKEYLDKQTGPLASTGLSQIAAILPSNATNASYPDLQLFIAGFTSNCASGEIGATKTTGYRSISISPTYLHTKSRGKFPRTRLCHV